MDDPAELYLKLGVSSSARPDEIKKAFRKAVMRWHPDKNPTNPQATAKFQEIAKAYEVLSNTEKRAAYDTSAFVDFNQDANPVYFTTVIKELFRRKPRKDVSDSDDYCDSDLEAEGFIFPEDVVSSDDSDIDGMYDDDSDTDVYGFKISKQNAVNSTDGSPKQTHLSKSPGVSNVTSESFPRNKGLDPSISSDTTLETPIGTTDKHSDSSEFYLQKSQRTTD